MLFFFYIFLFPSRKRPQEICIAVYDSLPLNSCHHNYFQTFMKALNSTDHCRTFTEKKKKKRFWNTYLIGIPTNCYFVSRFLILLMYALDIGYIVTLFWSNEVGSCEGFIYAFDAVIKPKPIIPQSRTCRMRIMFCKTLSRVISALKTSLMSQELPLCCVRRLDQ